MIGGNNMTTIYVDGEIVAVVPESTHLEYVVAQLISNLQYDNIGTISIDTETVTLA